MMRFCADLPLGLRWFVIRGCTDFCAGLNFDGAISSRLKVAQAVGSKLDAVKARHGVAERRKGAPDLPIASLMHGDLPSPAVVIRRIVFWLACGWCWVELVRIVLATLVATRLCTVKWREP